MKKRPKRRKRYKVKTLLCTPQYLGCLFLPVQSVCTCGAYLCSNCVETHLRNHAKLPPIRRDHDGVPRV